MFKKIVTHKPCFFFEISTHKSQTTFRTFNSKHLTHKLQTKFQSQIHVLFFFNNLDSAIPIKPEHPKTIVLNFFI